MNLENLDTLVGLHISDLKHKFEILEEIEEIRNRLSSHNLLINELKETGIDCSNLIEKELILVNQIKNRLELL